MKAIFQREFTSFFKNTTGYILCSVFILISGIFVCSINFSRAYAGFEYSLYNACFLYLLFIPILTMRSFAEEKKQKTDQLLLSLPISGPRIVMAKYFSMAAVLAIPTLILALIPLIMSFYGTVNFVSAYSSLFAFYLLGCALTAVGMLISSLTENQIISAILTFFVTLIAYFMSSVSAMLPASSEGSVIAFIALALILAGIMYYFTKSIGLSVGVWLLAVLLLVSVYFISPKLLEGSFQQAMSTLSVFDCFYGFVNGVFDLKGVIYYLSLSALFCYYTVVIFEKRRWS